MKALLYLKFVENWDAQAALLQTGDAELVEATSQPFWGGCSGGINAHGKLLSEVRNMIRAGQRFPSNVIIGDSILQRIHSADFLCLFLRGGTRIPIFRLAHLFLSLPGVQTICIHVGTNDICPRNQPRGSPARSIGMLF